MPKNFSQIIVNLEAVADSGGDTVGSNTIETCTFYLFSPCSWLVGLNFPNSSNNVSLKVPQFISTDFSLKMGILPVMKAALEPFIRQL